MKSYLNVNELSEYIHMSSSSIYKKTSLRQIPFIKSGKKLLFKRDAIDDWLDQHAYQTVGDIQESITGFLKPSKNQD